MKNNRNHSRQTRGWYPNDPTLIISSKATHSRKLEKWIANPFSTLGVLTIFCSLISAVLGTAFVSAYLTGYAMPAPGETGVRILWSGLFIGIFSLIAFALGIYSGILLLARKHLSRVATAMAITLACGVATLLAPVIEKIESWLGGWPYALPMIISAVATLCIAGLNMYSQRTKLANQQPPTNRGWAFIGLATAGMGLTAIGTVFYFAPIFPKQMVIVATLAIGIPLLVAAFLVRYRQNEAVKLQ
jgi:hypothetical protein